MKKGLIRVALVWAICIPVMAQKEGENPQPSQPNSGAYVINPTPPSVGTYTTADPGIRVELTVPDDIAQQIRNNQAGVNFIGNWLPGWIDAKVLSNETDQKLQEMERSIKPLLHENPGKGAIVQVVRWEHPPFGRTGVGQVYLIGVGQTPTEAFESAKDAASKGQSIIGAPFPKGLLPDPWGSFRVWYELSGDNLKATIIKQLPGITTFSTAKDLDQVRKDAYNKQKAFADEEERKADALASEAKARADAAAKETAEARARIEKERQEADLREAQHEQELRDLESQRSEQRTREQQARDDRQREAAQTAQRIIDAKEAVELQREKQDNEDAEKHRELEQKELEERQQRDKQEQDARAREQQEQQKKADEAKHIQDLLDNPPTTNPNPKGLTGVPDPGAGGESEPKPLPPNVAPFASTGNKSAFSVMLHNLDVDSSAGVATFIDPQTAKGVSVQFMPTQGRLH